MLDGWAIAVGCFFDGLLEEAVWSGPRYTYCSLRKQNQEWVHISFEDDVLYYYELNTASTTLIDKRFKLCYSQWTSKTANNP